METHFTISKGFLLKHFFFQRSGCSHQIQMFKKDLPWVSRWLWLIHPEDGWWWGECKCEPKDLRGNWGETPLTDTNLGWPVLFRVNDLRAAFQRADRQLSGCVRVSSSTGGRRMRGRCGGLKRHAAVCFNMPPCSRRPAAVCCVTVRQRETEWNLPVFVWQMHSFFSNVPMTVGDGGREVQNTNAH